MKKPMSDYVVLNETVLDAKEHENLRARGFVRAPSLHAQWLYLVAEAWERSGFPKVAEVEEYLVFMLERSVTYTELHNVSVGLAYFRYAACDTPYAQEQAQLLADTTLLYTGLFSESICHRHFMMKKEQLIDIGQDLYGRLWKITGDVTFQPLTEFYVRAMMVLEHVRNSLNPFLTHNDQVPGRAKLADITNSVDLYEAMFLQNSEKA